MPLSVIASTSAITAGAQTSVTADGSLNLADGDTVWISVMWEGGDTTVTVQKDSGSPANALTFDGADKTGQGAGSALFMASGRIESVAADAACTFKATLGASRTAPRMVVYQSRGGMQKGNSAVATGTAGTPSSGNIATTVANAIVFASASNDSGLTAGTETINGVAADGSVDRVGLSGWYRILSATFPAGAAACAAFGGGVQWVCSEMELKEGAAGATVPPQPGDSFPATQIMG